MIRYIAFLRAINVGGHVVKMDDLRRLFETLGLSLVKTFIASGNVIFEGDDRNPQTFEVDIASQLHRSLGYEVATFIRTAAELAEIAQYQPFPDALFKTDNASVYIGFTADVLRPEAEEKVLSFRSPVDDFHVHQREIYWQCQIRSSDSQFSLARLEKVLGVQATFRNSTTIRKIAKLYGEA